MIRLITIIILALGSMDALAGKAVESLSVTGTLESDVAFETSTGSLQKMELILTPELGFEAWNLLKVTLVGRIRGEFANDLDPGRPAQENRSNGSQRGFVGKYVDTELREAFFDTSVGDTFIRIGKQQVVWGQADGLKVLDVLNPQSFREFILDDFEDSRIPLWMINAEIPIADTLLQLLWIVDRTYDDLPEAGATYAFTSPLVVPVITANVPVIIISPERPDRVVRDSDLAASVSIFTGGWDLSLNYAYHYFDRPVIRREILASETIVRQKYERTHLVGGTFSNVFDDFSLRGEVGYSTDRFFLVADREDVDGVVHSGEFSYVLGLDYQGWRDLFVSAQLFQSIVTNFRSELIRERIDTNTTFLVRRDLLNDALQAELLVIQNLSEGDGLIQASINYEWRTNIRFSVGVDVFYGNAHGLFGQFAEKDRFSMGVEMSF